MPFDAEVLTQPKVLRPQASVGVPRMQFRVAPSINTEIEKRPTVRVPLPCDLYISTASHARITPLQTWEGYVQEVNWDKGIFSARLCDLEPDASGEEEVADLLIDDVDPDDHELVRTGGVFRWIIGYRDQPFGKRERISSLVFRRLPAWREADLKEAQEQGRKLAAAFQCD